MQLSDYYSLTEQQNRIIVTQLKYPESTMFVLGGKVLIDGILDLEILREAVAEFIRQNDSLRIRFRMESDMPVFYFSEDTVEIGYQDFSLKGNPLKCFEEWCISQIRKPFELLDSPLCSFAVIRVNENKCGYFIKLHHAIADGWSIQLLTDGICRNYESLALNGGRDINILPRYYYKDYVQTVQKYLKSSKYEKDERYWLNLYDTISTYPNDNSPLLDGERKTFYIPEEQSDFIKSFCLQNKLLLNSFFVGIFSIYNQARCLNQETIISAPVLGRTNYKEKNTFGMFVNILPYRIKSEEESSAIQYLHNVQSIIHNCYRHKNYPYNHLLRNLRRKYGMDVNLNRFCVNYYGTSINQSILGFQTHNQEIYNGQQEYSIQVIIREWNHEKRIQLDIDYKLSDWNNKMITEMYYKIIEFSSQIISNPQQLIGNFLKRSLPIEIQNQVLNATVIDLFRSCVEKNGRRLAIFHKEKRFTYDELNLFSERVAFYLQCHEIQKGDVIAVAADHSFEVVGCVLGIFKAGAVYLPIDKQIPIDRLTAILKDSDVKLILCDDMFWTLDKNIKLIDINKDLSDLSEGMLQYEVKLDDLAYIIYTSGTMGKPKGVMITHKNLANYLLWAQAQYRIDQNDIFPLYSSLSFDLTVTSLFLPLISGSAIKTYAESKMSIDQIIKDNVCTFFKLTPSHLRLLGQYNNQKSVIRILVVGGENFATSLAKEIFESFAGNIEIYNEYGPTEATIGCICHKYDPCHDNGVSVPIGKPIYNTRILLLNEECVEVPAGVQGEIYIGGECVGRGYVNQSELTTQKFIDSLNGDGTKLYKSGDLAVLTEKGDLVYLGRIDRQVKIRGYRVELDEIERVILKYNGVKQAIVLCQVSNGSQVLNAYYTVEFEIDQMEIQRFTEKYLPKYMVPQNFVCLESFSIKSNGKIDTSVLKVPDKQIADVKVRMQNGYAINMLLEDIKGVLNQDSISANNDFYMLGGDSIKAIQLSVKLQNKGYMLTVNDILSHPVLTDMAGCIHGIKKETVIHTISKGTIEITPIINWFLNLQIKDHNRFCQSVLLDMKTICQKKQLEGILYKLIDHHDSLRIGYNPMEKKLYYSDAMFEQGKISIEEHHLHVPIGEEENAIKTINEHLISNINLAAGELVKSALIHMRDGRDVWMIVIHHLAVDGISWRIILDDINTLIQEVYTNDNMSLPEKTASYQQWAVYLQQLSDRLEMEEPYWTEKVQEADNIFRKPLSTVERKQVSMSDEIEINEMLQNAQMKSSIEEILITALVRALNSVLGKPSMIIEMEHHGRSDPFEKLNISRTVGWFTTMYPLLIRGDEPDVGVMLTQISNQLKSIPHKGIGFGICKVIPERWKNEENWIRFNYLGEIRHSYELFDVFYINNIKTDVDLPSCLLEVNCMLEDSKLSVMLNFNLCKLDIQSGNRILKLFVHEVCKIIPYCYSNYTNNNSNCFDEISQKEVDLLFN